MFLKKSPSIVVQSWMEFGKLWPVANIWPTACLFMACKLRKAFTLLNGWIKIKRRFHGMWKIRWNSVFLAHNRNHLFTCCLWQSCATVTESGSWTETLGHLKYNVFMIWRFYWKSLPTLVPGFIMSLVSTWKS